MSIISLAHPVRWAKIEYRFNYTNEEKMKIVYEREAKIPDYALPYLINGDDSGISMEDKKIIDQWESTYLAIAEDWKGIFEVALPSNENWESYFTGNPEFGLACNVVDCTLLVLVSE